MTDLSRPHLTGLFCLVSKRRAGQGNPNVLTVCIVIKLGTAACVKTIKEKMDYQRVLTHSDQSITRIYTLTQNEIPQLDLLPFLSS